TILRAGLAEAAGRAAYLAGFHAAQALIFERVRKVLKTHHGVHVEFQRLTKDDARLDAVRSFLSRSYDLKSIADYEIDPNVVVSPAQAADAIAEAKRFVALLAVLADRPPP
ncbi:MAG: HEPN domain-containing protein, partial [Stellaceae bacterium]